MLAIQETLRIFLKHGQGILFYNFSATEQWFSSLGGETSHVSSVGHGESIIKFPKFITAKQNIETHESIYWGHNVYTQIMFKKFVFHNLPP